MKIELYFVCDKDLNHRAGGIYSRNRRTFNLFRLTSICFDYDNAVAQAKALAAKEPNRDFSVQGARCSNDLPEKYNP